MPRMMLIIGIIFTILSVFISYYVINKAQSRVTGLRTEISEYDDKINFAWRQQQELEQRYAMSVILYTLAVDREALDPARQAACSYVSDTINYHNIEMSNDTCSGIEFLSEKLKELQAQTIDNINDLYTKKVLLEAKMVSAQKDKEITQAIGVLLQVIGLILVLYFKP